MKNYLIVLTLLFAALAANAQTNAGTIMLGGNLAFSSQTLESSDAKISSFSIVPRAGYFFTDNLVAGLGIGFVRASEEFNSFGQKREQNEFQISPFLRYYSSLTENFYFFGELNVPISFINFKTTDTFFGERKSKGTSFGVNVRPGFAFFPSSKVGIDFSFGSLGFTSTRLEPDPNPSSRKTLDTNVNLRFDLSAISLGFHWYFGSN